MNTIIKSSNGITLVPVESRLLTDRKVFIEGEINAASACDFVKCLMLLIKEDAGKPIDVYINSPGGEVVSGMLILDALKGLKTEVNVWLLQWLLSFYRLERKAIDLSALMRKL